MESCGGGNWRVMRGSLDRTRWIEGWIYSQLTTRGEVSCEDHPLQVRDGGWWFDAFQPDNFRIGSKLWALNWARVNNETLLLAKQWAGDSLEWLRSWGIASQLNIDATWISVRPAVIKLTVAVRGPGVATSVNVQGVPMPDATYLWKEYIDNPLQAKVA
jgi:phage gp46-like protein